MMIFRIKRSGCLIPLHWYCVQVQAIYRADLCRHTRQTIYDIGGWGKEQEAEDRGLCSS